VYVAPNKALVNQVSADVYQRYGPVFGSATEDYQDKALTQEVLVTVPSVFEKLLLNPHREQWVKQIKVSKERQ
jgi:superfamily II RNA helicase